MKAVDITRRQFLKGTGALIVSFNLFPSLPSAFAQSNLLPNGDLDPAQLDSWLAIGQDGTVTLFTSKVDLGTGIVTALAQIAAEELDVSWKQIKVIQGDTALTVDQSATGGSRTVERAGPQVRQAAAAARKELMRLAAERLGVDADKLNVKDGVVTAAGTPSKKVSYGQLIGGKKFNVKITAQGAAAELKLAQDVKPKSVKEYQTVGTTVPRFDIPPKLTGEAIYINDLRIPGMLQGRVVRPPMISTDPLDIDEASIKNIPGVVKVVREGKFVGVVAKTEWAAIKAARALKVTWSKPTTQLPANAEELYAYLKSTKPMRSQKVVERGDVDTVFCPSEKILRPHLPLAAAVARHDRAVLRHRRRKVGQGDDLVRHSRTVSLPQEYRYVAETSGKRCAGDLLRRLRLLWPLGDRRCRRRRGAAISRSRRAGTGAVVARRRAWLVAQGAGASRRSQSRTRQRRQMDRLGLHGLQFAAHRSGRHTHAGVGASRHQAGQPRRLQWRSELRRDLRRRPPAHLRQSDQLALRRTDSAAHQPAARPGRYRALFRDGMHAR